MPLGFATLPLDPPALRALADAQYTIIDQAQRTPGLLIVQAPDEQGVQRPEAAGGPEGAGAAADGDAQ